LRKTTRLKQLINSRELEFLMEAHNGLSAKIVEENGFNGIWASGLAISAALGVRDNNEASWTQVLEVTEFMSDATKIPILLDGDTGYGNFNNARRLVKKLEQRQIAGVCIEDKLFPKTNSFINGETQPIANIEEFSRKIKAMKDSQTDDDFVVVARTEAFIAGWGLHEALKRAEEYRKAGADAILVHSKRTDIREIELFMKEWAGRHPIVIVPTKYYSVPTPKIKELGVSVVIWANHNLRAAINAMQKASKQIYQDRSLVNLEDKIVPVQEIFRIQRADELKQAEKKYLPNSNESGNAVVFATDKCVTKVEGNSLLSKQMEQFNQINIKNIIVVRDSEDPLNQTNELKSFYSAIEGLKGTTLISNGDRMYKSYIFQELYSDLHDITIAVDADVSLEEGKEYVKAKMPYSKRLYQETVPLISISSELEKSQRNGEFIGLWKVSEQGAQIIREIIEDLSIQNDFNTLTIKDVLNEVTKKYSVAVKYIKGSWLDYQTIMQLKMSGDLND